MLLVTGGGAPKKLEDTTLVQRRNSNGPSKSYYEQATEEILGASEYGTVSYFSP